MSRLTTRLTKRALTLTTALLLPIIAHVENASAKNAPLTVTVYAGPQSVSPKSLIYVTVEAADAAGNSLHNKEAVLSYKADGLVQMMTGLLENGLVSFEVPSQTTAGHMMFTAKVLGTASNHALVSITPGRAQTLRLAAKRGETPSSLALSSQVITDKFGNPISDLSPVLIDWVDETGLKARQTVQLSNGRVLLTAQCPTSFTGALKIRAALDSLQFTTPKLNSLCAPEKG